MNRTAEFTLSLIASIFMLFGWIGSLLFTIIFGMTPMYEQSTWYWFVYYLTETIVYIPITVLVWISTFKVKNSRKGWAIFQIVIGVIMVPSLFFIPGILLLISGIMTVSRHPQRNSISA